MLDLRDLECLIALTRHRHFAKAADDCGMSQPAFSMRIRHLEERLDTQIVRRGNRFQGLTSEGETIVAHAREILDQVRALEEEVQAARGEIVGSLMLAAIPTASAYAALIASWLRERHPGIRTRIETTTSLGIQQGIDDGRFDAGITYSEGAWPDMLQVEELYKERYVLLIPDRLRTGSDAGITWRDAAAMPLILLEPGMQNRRILDHIFQEVGVHPTVIAETSGFMAAVLMAMEGMGATVLPQVLVDSLKGFQRATPVPLTDPEIEKSVSLVTPRRAQSIPVVEALRRTALPHVR